jgi:hypothetical protein
MQPAREFPPNKTKENQIKPRKKTWISLDSFGRFGAFQRVTRNPNKKFIPLRGSRTKLYRALAASAFDRHQPDPADRKDIT